MLQIFARSGGARAGCVVAALSSLFGATSANAQFEDFHAAATWGRIDEQILVPIDTVQRVTITSLGRTTIDPGSEIGPRGCEETRTYTDASFEGGSYLVQAGFAQGETAATSYTIPAAHFPIKIVSIEMVFAQDQATVQTTTQWGVRVWAGTPSTGQLIRSFNSDGLILPHIEMPPGTEGTNVFFAIDPNDPNQIVLENNGTNTFSVGYSVNQHSDPPANPCQTAPPPRRNAFPVVDTSGLASATNNWIGAINCGPISCVPNGGFVRFSQLTAGLCRPSGDWVLRVIYRPLDCQPGVGACCLGGVCSIRVAAECTAQGGSYLGDGTTCAGVTCPTPNQACCFASTGGCLNLNPTVCSGAGGVPGGPGSNCSTFVCFPIGACCLPSGSCVGPVSPEACAAQGGNFQGNNTSCGSVNCPLPVGGCCFGNGFCIELSEADCGTAGGTWAGVGSNCVDGNGNGRADDCEIVCPGDVDSDNDVDLTDLATLLSNFGEPSGMSRADGDLDGDTDVDLSDLALLLANFGRTC